MRTIDMQTWTRREHFRLFNSFDHPHFNMCANMDLTVFHPYVKQHDISFTAALVYVLSRAANDVPEFRYRLREGYVVEHEVVHPSITVLTGDDLFGFCFMEFSKKFSDFGPKAAEQIAVCEKKPTLTDGPGRDDLLFMTAIPWVSFTSFTHPMHLQPPDSIPRFAWGKFFAEGDKLKMPLSVQGHHALMDGIHMGRYYVKVQGYLHQPKVSLG